MANLHMRTLVNCSIGLAGAECDWRAGPESGIGCGRLFLPGGTEFQVFPPKKGSRVYLSAHFRDLETGTAIKAGDTLPLVPSEPCRSIKLGSYPLEGNVLRVLPGPQADLFDLPKLFEGEFKVDSRSDRVGIRIKTDLFPHDIELPSEPAAVGVIQVVPNGGMILLGPDGPTIGGYPKIGVVITADRERMAQLRPGTSVKFEPCTLEEAVRLFALRERELNRTLNQIRLGLNIAN